MKDSPLQPEADGGVRCSAWLGDGPRCSACGGAPHTLGECPACMTRVEMADEIKRLHGDLRKLCGIIARNALQRLRGEDATELYVTADDIKDSLEVLYAWQASKSPNDKLRDAAT